MGAARQKILLVEDDDRLGRQIVEHLEAADYETVWLRNGDNALAETPDDYQLLILDLMLPGTYGMDLLRTFRVTSDVPVLILSARNDTEDKVRALQLGADDYVTKPFWPEELVARVRARIRRPAMQRGGQLRLGALAIDLPARSAQVQEQTLDLTRVEFDLLAALARRPGAAVSRTWLAEQVLDSARDGADRTLDVHISRLRKKLGACSAYVATVWGVGYRLQVPQGEA